MNINVLKIKKLLVSEKRSVKTIEPLICGIKEKIAMDDQSFYNMLIAVTEAVNNAIIHGNKCDPDKKVQIEIRAGEEEIEIIIKDEGEGFEPDNLDDPRAPENLLKEHGRGVFLMRELADAVTFEFTKKGTKITLIFQI